MAKMRDALAQSRSLGGVYWGWQRDQLLAELRRHDISTAARMFSMQLGGFGRDEIAEYAGARELERAEIVCDIDEIERGEHGHR
ncbi:MAG TPA: hypothetical protein VHW66_09375 [Stellaceae bacterium]|jgi:hypothetical protein|nr:hypothetical protein [Stellaceae bacterium]